VDDRAIDERLEPRNLELSDSHVTPTDVSSHNATYRHVLRCTG
jgi:hypothetical protein